MKQFFRSTLLFAALFTLHTANAQDARLKGLDAFIERTLQQMDAVGCAVTIVEKDKVILAKGYGLKDLAGKKAATENTLFQIGSCTKAFTTSIIGMLYDEKRLKLDQPVHQLLPELSFKDPHLTASVTVRDMMCHRTGLERHDLAWYFRPNQANRDTFLHIIRYFDTNAGLRERWQYNNFMFMAQGALAQKLTGKTWEALVQERIFTPLGMNGATLTTEAFANAADRSFGYSAQKGKIKKEDFYYFNGMEPAGSIAASAKDMGQWLKLWIHGGKSGTKELISTNFCTESIKTQMTLGGSLLSSRDTADSHGYGFGWFLGNHKGHFRVEHGGNIDGFSTTTAFYPNDSIGIFVSVNQNGSAVPGIIRNAIADRMLRATPTDWLKAPLKNKLMADTATVQNNDAVTQKPNTSPLHATAEYLGKYQNIGYGALQIMQSKDAMLMLYGKDTFQLQHFHFDIFKATHAKDPDWNMKIAFETNFKGDVSGLKTSMDNEIDKFVFAKMLSEYKINALDLAQYVGSFEISGITLKTYISKDVLCLLVPGQPEYELIGTKKDEFNIVSLDGFSVRFEISDKKPTAIFMIQPNGTFKALAKP